MQISTDFRRLVPQPVGTPEAGQIGQGACLAGGKHGWLCCLGPAKGAGAEAGVQGAGRGQATYT